MNKLVLKTKHNLVFFGLFLLYLTLRCVVWKNTVLFENHDSITYLRQIELFLTFDLQHILNDFSPDGNPFYPFFGALCSFPGWSLETGARLCSLIFSSLLFFVVLVIGKKIARKTSVALGLLFMSLNPVLVPLSFSVLTEPSYIALVYLGFCLFLAQYENPSFWKGGILGLVFGFAFLARTEGFLYLGIIPLFQGAHFLFGERKHYTFKGLIVWTIMFVSAFSILAVPQIWRVSHKMGWFAINGRQAWVLILKNPDKKSYDEKIYGLDYSPSQINLEYVQSHPEVKDELASNINLEFHLRTIKEIILTFEGIYQNQLGILIGPIGFIFFALGLLAIYNSGRRFETLLILAFIAANLLGPLMASPQMRYIAIIGPIAMLIEGIGAVYLYRSILVMKFSNLLAKLSIAFLLIIHFSGTSAYSLLYHYTGSPFFPVRYHPDDLKEPVAIVKQISRKELLRSPNISARKGYLAYFAECNYVPIPYTNYDGLVRYCDISNVDFIFIQHRLLHKYEYPFSDAFVKGTNSPDFLLLYRGIDSGGEKMELYRFKKKGGSSK